MNMNTAPGQGNQKQQTELTEEQGAKILDRNDLVEDFDNIRAHLKKNGSPVQNFKPGGERPDYVAGDEKYLVKPTIIQPYSNSDVHTPDFGETGISESTYNNFKDVLETPAYDFPGAIHTPYKDLALSPEQTEFIKLLSESIEEDNKFIAQKTISLQNALERNSPESQQKAIALQVELRNRKDLRNKKLLQKIDLLQDTTEFGDFYKQEYEGYLRHLALQNAEDQQKIKKLAAKESQKDPGSLYV